jgi:hypothetical protein
MDMVNKFRWWIIQLHRLEQHNVRFLLKKMEVNYFLELGSYHFLVQERLHGQIKQKSGVDHIRFRVCQITYKQYIKHRVKKTTVKLRRINDFHLAQQ